MCEEHKQSLWQAQAHSKWLRCGILIAQPKILVVARPCNIMRSVDWFGRRTTKSVGSVTLASCCVHYVASSRPPCMDRLIRCTLFLCHWMNRWVLSRPSLLFSLARTSSMPSSWYHQRSSCCPIGPSVTNWFGAHPSAHRMNQCLRCTSRRLVPPSTNSVAICAEHRMSQHLCILQFLFVSSGSFIQYSLPSFGCDLDGFQFILGT